MTVATDHDAELAARDAALPGLALLLDGDSLAAELQAAWPNQAIDGARALYVRYKRGVSCLVSYSLATKDGPVTAYARCQRREDIGKLAKVVKRARARSTAGPGGLLLPRAGVAVYLFPNDRLMPSLARLADHEGRDRLLARVLPGQDGLPETQLVPLRYKPERRFVAAAEADDGRRVLVRLYADGWERAATAARALESGGALHVPARLGRSRRHRAVAQEWLAGRPLEDLLRSGPPPTGPLAAAGAAVAELQTRPVRKLPPPDATHVERLQAAAEAGGIVLPHLAGRLEQLARRLSDEPQRAAPVPVHGDFAADQVLVDGDRVSVVDLDRAQPGDADADLAVFAAGLERDVLAGELSRADADLALDRLAAGYEEASSGPGRPSNRRVAAALVLLVPEPFRLRVPDWPSRTVALVERAEELADG